MKRTRTKAWLAAMLLATMIAGGCGKKAGEGGAAASGSASGTGSASASAAPTVKSAAVRAKEALDTAASVVQAMADAIANDRCGSAARVHAAVVASADKIAAVKAAFSDQDVLAEVAKIFKAEPMRGAMSAWMRTMVDGDCKVQEDKDTLLAMLQPAVDAVQKGAAAAQPAAAAPPAPVPPPPGGTSIPECDQLRGIAQRVDGCAALPPNIKKTLQEMAKNNLDATERSMPDNYKEYARPKCAGTAETLTKYLADYGCK